MANGGGSASAGSQEPLSPAASLFHAKQFSCYIIAIVGCKTSINPGVIKLGLENTLIKHPRFSSKLVIKDHKISKMKWEHSTVNLEDHIIHPKLDHVMDSPDQFVEDYISHLSTMAMDFSKPLWEMHILNVKTLDAEAVAVLRIHHSMGDGASLISLLLACTRKTVDPEALPSVPVKKRGSSSASSGGFWWFFLAIWTVLRMLWNTLVDLILFVATILFLKDTNTPLKGGPGVELKPKRFVHRTFSMDDIKLVKNAMNVTVNDVIMGVTQAGLSQYLIRKYGVDENGKPKLPKSIRLRAGVLVNLRPTAGIQDLADLMKEESKTKWGWGNRIGYIILPITINSLQDNPSDYVRQAKSMLDRKKLSLEAAITYKSAIFTLKTLGVKAAAAIAHSVLSNTTLAFSNLVGPLEEISFFGHPIAYLAPSVYGNPHALTIHCQSYCRKLSIVLAVDPDVIPDPYRLCDDLESSLNIIRDAIVGNKLDVV